MSFAAGAFTSGLRSGGGGGGGDGGPRKLFSRIKDGGKGAGGKDGKEGPGPSPITATLMFQAMANMSPGGASSGSANKDAKDLNDQQNQGDHHYDKKNYETDHG